MHVVYAKIYTAHLICKSELKLQSDVMLWSHLLLPSVEM